MVFNPDGLVLKVFKENYIVRTALFQDRIGDTSDIVALNDCRLLTVTMTFASVN